MLTIRTALVSLASLLSTPEPSDPQDAEVAKHFLTDRPSFEATAKYWTQVRQSLARERTCTDAVDRFTPRERRRSRR